MSYNAVSHFDDKYSHFDDIQFHQNKLLCKSPEMHATQAFHELITKKIFCYQSMIITKSSQHIQKNILPAFALKK